MIAVSDQNGYLVYGMKEQEDDADYISLLTAMKEKPEPIEGHEWKLKYPSFEWGSVEVESETEIDDTEAFDIIFGGAE